MDSNSINSDTKIIPNYFSKNYVSPTAEKIVRIDKQGNVDFFIKCGNYCGSAEKKEEDREYVYYKFSFQVDTKFYKDYKSLDNFVKAIKGEPIKKLTVSIIRPKTSLTIPKTDLTDVHGTYFKQEIQNIDTTIEKILKDMKDIGFDNWTVAMAKFLIGCGLKKEAIELSKKEFKEIIEAIDDIKNKELKQQLEENEELRRQNKELKQQLNNKDKDFEQQLKEKDEVLKQLDEELKQKLKEKDEELKQQLKENEEKSAPLAKGNEEKFAQQLKENKELKQQLEEKNEDLKGTLYKKKDKGFLSIFSYCTCGLDKVAEKENEMKFISE